MFYTVFLFYTGETSVEELPTLLHLVAKFGLQEVAAWLSGQKGVQMACSITNQSNHYPGDIARNYGHTELSSFLQDLIDLVGPRLKVRIS